MKGYREWGFLSVAVALSVFVARVAIWQYFDIPSQGEVSVAPDSPISTPPRGRWLLRRRRQRD